MGSAATGRPGLRDRGAGTGGFPSCCPIRHGRMMVSPFAFFRGTPRYGGRSRRRPRSGLRCQLCGDAHLVNFGVFASPDRRLVFDINDFDETLPARGSGTSNGWPRASRSPAGSNGFADTERGRDRSGDGPAATATPWATSPTMRDLDVWYARIDVGRAGAACRTRRSSSGATSAWRAWTRRGPRQSRAPSPSSPTRRRPAAGSSATRR